MVSRVERSFVNNAVLENKRLDGRENEEYRKVTVNFGTELGSVIVTMGQTKVLAQVSCELGEPKATRPTEGLIFFNVELAQMARPPDIDIARASPLNVQISRTLERTFKESRCVDLESLCVRAEEHVWILRVDLTPLNHDGNLIDCCSIAALCGLAHFRRPDFSIVDDKVRVHTAAEKELIPMLLHHYPVCVSFCTFDDGSTAAADPTLIEERVSESQMIFGLNSFRELCCLNMGGKSLTSPQMLLQCATKAAKRAKYLVDFIKRELAKDTELRESGKRIGFDMALQLGLLHGVAEENLFMRLRHFKFKKIKPKSIFEHAKSNKMEVDNESVTSEDQMEMAKKSDKMDAQESITTDQTKENIIRNEWLPEVDDAEGNADGEEE